MRSEREIRMAGFWRKKWAAVFFVGAMCSAASAAPLYTDVVLDLYTTVPRVPNVMYRSPSAGISPNGVVFGNANADAANLPPITPVYWTGTTPSPFKTANSHSFSVLGLNASGVAVGQQYTLGFGGEFQNNVVPLRWAQGASQLPQLLGGLNAVPGGASIGERKRCK